MFNIKVTRFDHPQVYYDIQLSLPETVKEKMADYDKFFALLYKLGDSLFGEDKKSAFFAFGVIYSVLAENAPDWVKLQGDAGEEIYNLLS